MDSSATAWTPADVDDGAAAAIRTDIVVIGAGFAGALAGIVLARQGLDPVIIDPYDPYPADFRCEKFSAEQVAQLRELGVVEAFQAPDLLGPDAHALTRRGLRYDQMVNALRRQWPEGTRFLKGKVQAVHNSPARQTVTLSDGQVIDARLVVLATGPGEKLRAELGIGRDLLSANHSVCIGFSLGGAFGFDGLIHRGETAGDGVGYASLFRIGDAMRVNLFLYDDPKSDRIRAFRLDPLGQLVRAMPNLRTKLLLAEVEGQVETRVTDLYEVRAGHVPGVVLIGDARSASCPASGTGISRILSDVRALARDHAPRWLTDEGMAAAKIAAFYDDRTLQAEDALRHRRSLNGRQLAVNTAPAWRLRRVLHAARAWLRPPPAAATVVRQPLLTGDLAVVASAQAILATLDDQGCLDGLPFMPEMVPHIGKTLRVHHRADRTCVEGHGIRRMDDAVFLEEARCDGRAHDGCQRACLMFWKEAWLQPAGNGAGVRNDAIELKARLSLLNLATRNARGYMCQSTQLAAATRPLSRVHVGALVGEIRQGELSLAKFADIVARSLINRVRGALRLPELGLITGVAGRKTKGDLDLKPGDWVRVRSVEEVRASLGPNAKNLGLSFEPEMALSIGQVRQVEAVVERMVHEETGQMVGLVRTVTLKGAYCQGLCSKACPRANPLFWREIWLERVGAPQ